MRSTNKNSKIVKFISATESKERKQIYNLDTHLQTNGKMSIEMRSLLKI